MSNEEELFANDIRVCETQSLILETSNHNAQQKSRPNYSLFFATLKMKTGDLVELLMLPRRKRTATTYSPTKAVTVEKHFPFFIITVSLIQVVIFKYFTEDLWQLCEFNPRRRYEIWRFFTIMLLHVDFSHIAGNLVMQLPLGCLLETIYHWKRIGFLYFGGVIFSALASSVLQPRAYGVGCTGGVYALVTAYIVTIMLNWREMEYANLRCLPFVAYIFYWEVVVSFYYPVGHSAHFGASVAGVCLGFVVLKQMEPRSPWRIRLRQFVQWVAVVFVVICIVANILLYVDHQINSSPQDDSPILLEKAEYDEASGT